MLRGIATGSSPVCLVLSRVHNYKRGEVGVQSLDKGHNVETWFKCTYVQVFLVPIYVHMSAGLLASIMPSELHHNPQHLPLHSLLFHISSPAVPRYIGTSDIQISDVAASEMLLHACRDISRSVWQPLTLSFAIVPSAIAKKTLLPRLVMSRTESFMIQDHTSHCDWWLKARSWKSRVPTRTSPEGEW